MLQVRGSVIDTLPSADFDDLPIIVKFLLQTVSAAEAAEVKVTDGIHPMFQVTLWYRPTFKCTFLVRHQGPCMTLYASSNTRPV